MFKYLAKIKLENDYADGGRNGATKVVEITSKQENASREDIVERLEEDFEYNMYDMWKLVKYRKAE